MRDFTVARATTVQDAIDVGPDTALLAGGTTLVDLMKLDVVRPRVVLDINALPLRGISIDETGMTVGSGVRMDDLAEHPELRRRHQVVVQALLAGASQQLRAMASIGGNLLQRTRCPYFRDVGSPCNRREPGSGCPAIEGSHRTHAIFGTGDSCVATHPSDLAVALVASDATVEVTGRHGRREVPVEGFHRPPGNSPHVEHVLENGEVVTAVRLPRPPEGTRSTYVKVRDRASYEFALASAAVRLQVVDDVIVDAHVVAGGVATVPWRLSVVEQALRGRPAVPGTFDDAVADAANDARPLRDNGYKVPLLEGTVLRAIEELVVR